MQTIVFLPIRFRAVAETDGCRLALARRRRVDGGHQDEPAVPLFLLRRNELGAHLGLVMAVGKQMLRRNA